MLEKIKSIFIHRYTPWIVTGVLSTALLLTVGNAAYQGSKLDQGVGELNVLQQDLGKNMGKLETTLHQGYSDILKAQHERDMATQKTFQDGLKKIDSYLVEDIKRLEEERREYEDEAWRPVEPLVDIKRPEITNE